MIFIFPPQAGHSVTLRYARPKGRATQARHRSERRVQGAGPRSGGRRAPIGVPGTFGVSAALLLLSPRLWQAGKALPAVLARCGTRGNDS